MMVLQRRDAIEPSPATATIDKQETQEACNHETHHIGAPRCGLKHSFALCEVGEPACLIYKHAISRASDQT